MHDHTDTWGIPSQTFLQWYLVAAAVAALFVKVPDAAPAARVAPTSGR